MLSIWENAISLAPVCPRFLLDLVSSSDDEITDGSESLIDDDTLFKILDAERLRSWSRPAKRRMFESTMKISRRTH